MRNILGAPIAAAAISIFALSACSQPEAEQTADATAATAAGVTDQGGVVSAPPSPQNDAVNTDANTTTAMSQSAGSNSFTEGQARGHIENAGYTDVTGLTKTPDGMWTGKAMKDGKTMDVSLDFRGAVTAR
ncbi:MAG: hypothetical protein U1C74_09240 [Phenylobacterium sp.]|nr:hypothetical protein [Phenylobacterium sp.]